MLINFLHLSFTSNQCIMKRIYDARAKEISEEMNKSTEKSIEWLYRILFLSATLFGILISLHSKSPDSQLQNLCFAISIVLLAAGILLLSTALYSVYKLYQDSVNIAVAELLKAVREGRIPAARAAVQKRFYVFCEKVAYVCLILSCIFLALYSVLSLDLDIKLDLRFLN